jgi:hypothetical protein
MALYGKNHLLTTEPSKDVAYTVLFKDPVRTAQKTLMSVIKTNLLLFYREKVGVCSGIDTKHTNTMCVQFLNAKPAGAPRQPVGLTK